MLFTNLTLINSIFIRYMDEIRFALILINSPESWSNHSSTGLEITAEFQYFRERCFPFITHLSRRCHLEFMCACVGCKHVVVNDGLSPIKRKLG